MEGKGRARLKGMGEGRLSVVVHALFSSWMLSFLFEGQIFYSLAAEHGADPGAAVFCGVSAVLAGLLLCGLLIKTKRAAKRLFLCAYPFFILVSAVFFFPPSALWTAAVVAGSLLAGGCVAAWGFYFKSGTPKNQRIKTAADMLILSNILMILLNTAAVYISPRAGLALSMLMLCAGFALALRLPSGRGEGQPPAQKPAAGRVSLARPLVFLCLFIALVTVNSGIMYQVVNPAFSHLSWLTGWYWAVPYVAALFVMRNLPGRANRAYILYAAVAMLGFSFIGFMALGRSAASYLAVNTLMLGACGVFDLFWWSILGEMLDFFKNPGWVLGLGLSANVLGVLLGGLLGKAMAASSGPGASPALPALAVVCATVALLPPLHKSLSALLKGHTYLAEYTAMPPAEKTRVAHSAASLASLTGRENQVTSLLLEGKTCRMIAGELSISENTVKYHIKNIYGKFGIQSRAELMTLLLEKRPPAE